MSIIAGRLDKRIILQVATIARDDNGQPIETFATVAEIWAAIEPIRGREFFAAQQVSADTTHRLTIRYRPGVSVQNRILFGSRVFRIESIINPQERSERLELMCVETLT